MLAAPLKRKVCAASTAVAVLLVAVTVAPGCPSYENKVFPLIAPTMPVSSFYLTRRPYEPYSLKFRLGLINFVDQTQSAGSLVKTIPDVLTTGLYETARFDLYDRGQLRSKNINDLHKEKAKLPVDGLLTGAITQIDTTRRKILCDVRVTNKFTDAVMYATSFEIGYTGTLEIKLNRKDIAALSRQVARQFPKMDERTPAKIVEISGTTVTINAGADRQIKPGMAAIIQAPGELKRDIDSGEVLQNRSFVALVMVISVLDRVSKARVVSSGDIRVKDYVVFK